MCIFAQLKIAKKAELRIERVNLDLFLENVELFDKLENGHILEIEEDLQELIAHYSTNLELEEAC